jgi:Fe-S-cluster containining protein
MPKKNNTKKLRSLTVLTPENYFQFKCHQNLDCFTRCCRDITVFLTPYDVLRMKKGLNILSEDFLADYTMTMIGDTGLPVVVLKMRNDAKKSCPFVTRRGCMIYPHRPWSCRIYPLQPESTKITEKAGREYYSVMNIPFCFGFAEDNVQTVEAWIEEQGIPIYQEMEAPFKKITTNEFLVHHQVTNKKIQEMYYMACYDLDRFRSFILESTFLDRFEMEPEVVEKIKEDDIELYHFAMKWLEYGLLGQHVLKVKPDVMEPKKKELEIK